jgi:hypothetical protein
MEFRDTIQSYSEQPITRQILLDLLKEYKRPYDKISELVKQGMLQLVRRGIYIPGPALKIAVPEPFLLANHLLGPSYVSMETALSYWGWIPEKVYEVSSMTIKNSAEYDTASGRFSYTHLALPYYSFGLQQVELSKRQTVIMATPEKALCDKIVATSGVLLRSTNQVMEFLIDDLRIDEERLEKLKVSEIGKWVADAPKRNSIDMLIKTLSK